MPKHKTDDPTTSDSGPDDVEPAKKAKQSTAKSPEPGPSMSFELGHNKRAGLSEFKGRVFVNIREYYDANGVMKPGKKGVSLTVEQYKKLKEILPMLDELIKKQGR